MLGFLGGLSACLLGIGIYAGSIAVGALERKTTEGAYLSAKAAATLLARSLSEREEEIRLLARAPHLVSGDLASPAVRGSLNARKELRAEYAWLGVATPDGRLINTSEGLLLGADVSARHWFAEARSGHYVGDVHEAILLANLLPQKDDGQPLRFIDISAPIIGADNTWRGVLGAHIDWDWVTQMVEHAARNDLLDPSAQVLIADRDGSIIYPYEMIGHERLPTALPEAAPFGAAIWRDGQTYLTTAARVTPNGDTDWGWSIVLRQPISTALAEARALRNRLIVLGLVSAAGLALLGWRLAIRISGPIEHLARLSRRIENGEKTVDWLDGKTLFTSEVASLQMALQGMTSTLFHREEELTDLNRQLESKVRDRTIQLEHANIAKRDFLASMSHEIRTPMNSVIGLSNLLMRSGLEDQQRLYAEKIHTSGTALLGVLNDILDYTKIETGALAIETITFDLHEMIGKVDALFGEQARAKGIDFLIESDPKLTQFVVGDPLRLLQVVNNLVSNAIKFTQSGFVKVTFQCISQTHGPGSMKVIVRDTGPGIEPDKAESLFDAYQQGDISTARLHGGSGLGLTISKRLMEMMGGSIGVESAPGLGSSFWLRVRLGAVTADAVHEVERQRRHREAAASFADLKVATSPVHGARVLLVDDNETNLLVGREYLARLGFDVTVARGGEEALSRLSAADTPFEALLLDLHMPGLSGLDVARRLRLREAEGDATPRLPIIIQTAAPVTRDDPALVGAGVDDVVNKPIQPVELMRALLGQIRPEAIAAFDEDRDADCFLPAPYAPNVPTEAQLRLRASFLRDFAGLPDLLMAAAAGADPEEALRALHSLKGLAPTIGAGELQERAAAAEADLARGHRDGLPRLANRVARVLADLRRDDGMAARPGKTAPAPMADVNGAELGQAIDALIRLCDEGRLSAAEQGRALADRLAGTAMAGRMDTVLAALARFDFDAARSGLTHLHDVIGVPA
jgi:signal transduction histidine kinase/CheY-like chemotaxis protein